MPGLLPPARLMLTTQGADPETLHFDTTWLIPAMIPAKLPEPPASSTLTTHNSQLLETPYFAPQVVPATWVLKRAT